MVVSVITQYRILKFIAINVKETLWLRKPLRDLDIGTFTNVASFKMDTPVMETVHVMVRKNISSVPVVNDEGRYFILLPSSPPPPPSPPPPFYYPDY